MASLKYSRQRDAVRQFVQASMDHPTAESVYEHLRIQYPNISLGTVYRNLNLLSELGEIRRLTGFTGVEHFDGRLDPHCHFICQKCRRIYDIDGLDTRRLMEEVSRTFQGEVTGFSGKFTGLCQDCVGEAS